MRKIGHAGTLDPLATGLLVCGVGRASRLLGYIQGEDKTYMTRLRFGVETTTEDSVGPVTALRGAVGLTREAVLAAAASFLGEIEQVPSAVSAIKVNGQRAYSLVRQGKAPQLRARRVRISRLEWGEEQRHLLPLAQLTNQPPGTASGEPAGFKRPGDALVGRTIPVFDIDLTLDCSAGTYVRALARDLGQAVGTGAHVIALRRLRTGPFDVAEAGLGQQQFKTGGPVSVLPVTAVMSRILPLRRVEGDLVRRVGHGQTVSLALDGPTLLVGPADEALAVYAPAGEEARPLTVVVGGQ
jgi:tRNA pseudouridine55 synthase